MPHGGSVHVPGQPAWGALMPRPMRSERGAATALLLQLQHGAGHHSKAMAAHHCLFFLGPCAFLLGSLETWRPLCDLALSACRQAGGAPCKYPPPCGHHNRVRVCARVCSLVAEAQQVAGRCEFGFGRRQACMPWLHAASPACFLGVWQDAANDLDRGLLTASLSPQTTTLESRSNTSRRLRMQVLCCAAVWTAALLTFC